MKYRNAAVFTFFLLAAVILALGACSGTSTPTGASKALVFVIDDDGNSRHEDGWKRIHPETTESPDLCGDCHASESLTEPPPSFGCFDSTLCHGDQGFDSDDSDDSDDFDDSDDSDDFDDSDDSDEVEI